MGNVSAAESSKTHGDLPSPPLLLPQPSTEIGKSQPKETSHGSGGAADVLNPGLYEDLHKQTKGNTVIFTVTADCLVMV